jgi:hypothetical protein
LTSRTTESRRLRLWPTDTVFLVVLTLAACGGEGLILPNAGDPSRIAIVSGDGQIGTVGQPLGAPFVVKVTDPEDRPVEGVEVVFVPPAGATVAPNPVFTDAGGEARVHYTLAPVSGDQSVEARATPVVPSPTLNIVLHAMAQPEAATSLVLADGDEQIGETRSTLADSLVVQAVDRFGNGVPGVEVTWEGTGGSVSPASVITGADGRAATQRTLGDKPGSYPTTASAADLEGSPVGFTATGIAPPSPQLILVTQPSTTASAGVRFSRQPVLQLQDAVGAPLPQADVVVTVQIASGSGSLGGRITARSNADGVATFTDLSIRGEPGKRTLIFAASDFTSAISNQIDVGPGPAFAGASSASIPATGTPGVPTTIAVQLRDAFGTPVEAAAQDIAISIAGANPVSSLGVTEGGGGSYSASYTPTLIGTDQVDVRVKGEAVTGSPFASVVAAGPADPATTTAVVTRRFVFFFWVIDIFVTTRDSHGNVLGRGGDQVLVAGGAVPVQDNGDGTYVGSFNTVTPDQPVDITLNGVPIAGSPYTPQ